jgi:DNA-binding Lrp family transcriptional regulator
MDGSPSSSDLLVLLKLAASADTSASVRDLAGELGISKSAVALSLKRLEDLELIKGEAPNRRINKLAARDLLEHAARWIAPAKAGDWELGLPTAHSEAHLAARFHGDAEPVVLPLPHGPLRGRAVPPLHPQAPAAAARDPRLHRLLAIVDSLRIGRAREREVAAAELRLCL